jgi:hypothetical protein
MLALFNEAGEKLIEVLRLREASPREAVTTPKMTRL